MNDYDELPPDDAAGFGKMLPCDISAEQSVLGSMLLSTKVINLMIATVKPESFSQPQHAVIFSAITSLYGRSTNPKIDPITVADELASTGDLAKIGGSSYLHSLVQSVPTIAHAERHAEIVRKKAGLRAVIEATTRATARAYAEKDDPDAILDDAMADLQGAAGGTGHTDTKLSVSDRWSDFLDELEAGKDPLAIDTPWRDLNDVVELKPGQLVTVGAATGGGKSLFGMNLASHVAFKRKRPALVASMEMGGSELMARLVAAEAGVDLDRLVRRKLNDHDWAKVIKVNELMGAAEDFILDDSSNLTLSKIRARLRWMASQGRPAAIVIADYLQLMSPEDGGNKNRAQEVADISRGLKVMAMEFEIPIVALAQFNRGAVGRAPLVTDFKDSSSIEQDSNVIMLLHRPLAEDGTDTGPRAGEIDVIVAKNRNGANGRIIPLIFQGHFARLSNYQHG
ncbi:replicative DNA helicase [Streptomyces sp. NBC_00140]|uniref:replicative DNA helicase n=1 Tax=Streptomyces sp. NBC_00140 TaxID=2975664 RepID=UPI00225340D6|nr:replicative DNA helicase [Streptomyces sp. NBC_00140]MCX5336934.1 replicative DNA helicase [Streptomyces sp. NBC_00140]MCX5338417.1 replicative DNA helicase [Streptomyces sp. NBC_00140]